MVYTKKYLHNYCYTKFTTLNEVKTGCRLDISCSGEIVSSLL